MLYRLVARVPGYLGAWVIANPFPDLNLMGRLSAVLQFLASWRKRHGPDDLFDSFLLAVMSAAACLAQKHGAAALQTRHTQAVLSAIAQPETAALLALAFIALPIWQGSQKSAKGHAHNVNFVAWRMKTC